MEISIPLGRLKLKAELTIPRGARAIIIFCQAAGSSRNSLRSRIVARHLQKKGFGTLLPDLLTPEESNDNGKQSDQSLLTARLMAVTEWLMDRDLIGRYRLGYYSSSTGAASALQAASYLPEAIGAVVCRERQLMVVEKADHLFENGKMEYVAEMTAGWFKDHFKLIARQEI